MQSGLATSSSTILFNRSSNWPLYLVPDNIDPMSIAYIFLLTNFSGTSPLIIRIANPSAIAVFPTPA